MSESDRTPSINPCKFSRNCLQTEFKRAGASESNAGHMGTRCIYFMLLVAHMHNKSRRLLRHCNPIKRIWSQEYEMTFFFLTVFTLTLGEAHPSAQDYQGKVHAGCCFEGAHSNRDDFTLIISPFTHRGCAFTGRGRGEMMWCDVRREISAGPCWCTDEMMTMTCAHNVNPEFDSLGVDFLKTAVTLVERTKNGHGCTALVQLNAKSLLLSDS